MNIGKLPALALPATSTCTPCPAGCDANFMTVIGRDPRAAGVVGTTWQRLKEKF